MAGMRNSRPPSYFGRLSGISAVQESLDELRRAVSDSIARSEADRALMRKTSEDVARLSQDVLALQNATAKSLEAAVSGVQASSQSASNYVAELTRHLADLKIQGTAADRIDAIGASIGDLLQILLHDITTHGPVALLEAERRLAIDSDDHRFPRGTRNDNTRYPRFRWKCEQVCGRKLSLLDIGCAGGGIVLEFLLAGHFALGLEGSDYSMRTQRACWRLIPNHLMTCDVTRPFCLHNTSNSADPVRCDQRLGGARAHWGGRLTAVFQEHTEPPRAGRALHRLNRYVRGP